MDNVGAEAIVGDLEGIHEGTLFGICKGDECNGWILFDWGE